MSAVKPDLWHLLFLEERPSIGLSFFRIFVALTTMLHVVPSFFHLDDNYFATAFKVTNGTFFTDGSLRLVAQSPDWVVAAFVAAFMVTCLMFLVGLYSQVSCILMTACCYYFYALNSFHIGTLSWDILLVTLFLMCVTGYHGDYFSIDALRRGDPDAYKRTRPFFIQRLLQLQVASTFFYTALYKISPQGNWITGNPIHALMNYPTEGVTKTFLLKEWLATQPHTCYWLGIFIVGMELSLPFLLFWHKTRRSAIILGCIFHLILVLTLDVPAIFLFLFPAQLLLFVHPQTVMGWIGHRRRHARKLTVVYDGNCGFCKASVARLKVMDLWGHLDYRPVFGDLKEVQLIDGARTYGGFYAFRRMCWSLPMLYPLLLAAYLPGAAALGCWGYQFIADHRYWFHIKGNACAIDPRKKT